MSELPYLAATELRQHYLSGVLSPVEVAIALLERIDKLNTTLNAYVTVTAEHASDAVASATGMASPHANVTPSGTLVK